MGSIIEKASAGNRQAMTVLYEKYWKGAKAICSGCLGDTDTANATVIHAFCNSWDYLLNKSIQSEEGFQLTLYKQAAILCRKAFVKKGMKGLAVPQNKNFTIVKMNDTYTPNAEVLDNFLAMQPGINRYIFVLHRIAGFDEKMISSITGYKKDVVEAALMAEEQNAAKVLEQLSKNTGKSICLENEIKQYSETAFLPETYRETVLAHIDALVRPIERKKIHRYALYAVCAVCLIVLICVMAVSSGKKEVEFTGSATSSSEGTEDISMEGDTTESEDTAESEDAVVLSEDQLYYADITIEGYGTITVELDQESAPITVENFISLAEADFYDGLTFHRIMDGFMMQGGDPNGDGTGGAEETIVGEFTENGYENHLSHTRGVISMARSSAYDSASSQFFIVHEDSTFLDGDYAAFGCVTEGMEIVDAICEEAEPTDDNGTIPSGQQPVITSIDIRTENKSTETE